MLPAEVPFTTIVFSKEPSQPNSLLLNRGVGSHAFLAAE